MLKRNNKAYMIPNDNNTNHQVVHPRQNDTTFSHLHNAIQNGIDNLCRLVDGQFVGHSNIDYQIFLVHAVGFGCLRRRRLGGSGSPSPSSSSGSRFGRSPTAGSSTRATAWGGRSRGRSSCTVRPATCRWGGSGGQHRKVRGCCCHFRGSRLPRSAVPA